MRALIYVVSASLTSGFSRAVDCDACWKTGFAPDESCCSQCRSQCPSGRCAMIHSTGYECYNPQTQVLCNLGTAYVICNSSAVCPSAGPCTGGAFPGSQCSSCPVGHCADESHCGCVAGPQMLVDSNSRLASCLSMGAVCNPAANTCCEDEAGEQMQCAAMGAGPPVCISGTSQPVPSDKCKWMGKLCSATPNGTCGWDDPDEGVSLPCQYENAACTPDAHGQRRCMIGPPINPALFI
mmetsp:Transcript_50814/g.91311  ORF Transcript_50814/g.91311 Transcript_50814/m.91311 type:complete len:238 (+) Transcript_50814:40-753(+)